MALRYYLMPQEFGVPSWSTFARWRPKYLMNSKELWSARDYGFEGHVLVGGDFSPALVTQLLAAPDVYAFPEDRAQRIGSDLVDVRGELEARGFPARWINANHTVIDVLAVTGRAINALRSIAGLQTDRATFLPPPDEPLSALPAVARLRMAQVADKWGFPNEVNLPGNTPMWRVMEILASNMPPMILRGVLLLPLDRSRINQLIHGAVADRNTLATESFSAAPGSAWTQYGPRMWSASGGELSAWGADFAFAGYTDVTWPNDQWSKITHRNTTVGEDYSSVELRLSDAASGGDGYSSYTDGSGDYFISRWDNGASTDLQNLGTAPTSGDNYSLEVIGTSLNAFKNDSGVGTTETESTYSSGDAGCGAHYGGTGIADDWLGGDFVTGIVPFRRRVEKY